MASTAAAAELTPGPVLTGGGARAAYQAGRLKAIARIWQGCGPGGAPNPFPVITGTSAGAINASALACRAHDFDGAAACLCEVWENFSAEQVDRADSFGVTRTGARWLTMMSIGWSITQCGAMRGHARCSTTRRSRLCRRDWYAPNARAG